MILTRREKGRNSDISLPLKIWRSNNGGTPYLIYDQYWPAVQSSESLKGWDIDHFHARRTRGELLPFTAFDHVTMSGSVTGTSDSYYSNDGTHYHDYSEVDQWRASNRWMMAEDIIRANMPEQYVMSRFVQGAAAKIYGNGHDTLTFLVELADVKELFVKTAKKLLTLRFPPNWRRLRITSEWLSTRYGWRTLIYDLQDLYKLTQSFQERKSRYSERSGDNFTSIVPETIDTWENGNHWIHNISNTIVVKVRGSVVADVTIPKLQFNPLQTGWELIPFSFVLDWFVSVGKVISALSFLSLKPEYVAAMGCSITVSRTATGSIVEYGDPKWSGTCFYNGSSKGELEYRLPCTVPLVPYFNVNLNPWKVFDLIALVIQQSRR